MRNSEDARSVPNIRLRRQRQLCSWTQTRLALEIGTTTLNVSRWERGLTQPNPYFRRQLCNLFKKTPAELGFDKDTPLSSGFNAASASLPYDPAIPLHAPVEGCLVGRAELMQRLILKLCSQSGSLALCGLPGVGKTALALELVYDQQIREYFRDGVLWASIGREDGGLVTLERWGRLLGIPRSTLANQTSAGSLPGMIRDAIGMRCMLVVIDDVWKIEDALLYRVGGPNCTYLLTTRLPELAARFTRGEVFHLPELDADASVLLLERLVPGIAREEPERVQSLVNALGGLPLALTLCGKYLRLQVHSGQPRRLRATLERLNAVDARLKLAMPQAPADTQAGRSLYSAIQSSECALSAVARTALLALADVPVKPATFSRVVALKIAGVTEEALNELWRAGLLERGTPGRYMLHRVIADYAKCLKSAFHQ